MISDFVENLTTILSKSIKKELNLQQFIFLPQKQQEVYNKYKILCFKAIYLIDYFSS